MKIPPTALLLGALLVTTVGCKKFLDQPVLGQYESSQFFTSDTNAILAVNAAYVPLSFRDGGSNVLWVLGDVASDDAVKGSNPGDQADFENIDIFNITPINAAVEAQWRRNYDGIFKCNVVLDGLPASNTSVSATVRQQVVGQAQFLRAYYYFQLAAIYGNVPLRLKVETPEELQSPAVPQAQIFAQVELDCQAAMAALPPTWTGTDVGRATKGAAMALLAKTYLYEQKWAQAAQTAQAVEALGTYSLLPVFADNFRAATKNNAEAIFSVQHTTGLSPTQGNNLNQWFAPRPQNGYGFFLPTQSLVDNFERTSAGVVDPRLDYSVGRAGQSFFGVPFDPTWATTGYVSKKHLQPLTEIPTTTKGDGNLNFQAIRYAEVLLIDAEASNEAGNNANALKALNQVRKRARESYLYDNTLPGAGTVPTGLLPNITLTDQGQLRDAIRRERRAELALEFQRFFDIGRYGQAYAQQALADRPNFNYARNRFFPIPQSERDTNKAL
ncbi:RagB/SusD family nutrient uptake outer membrane protein [Hymenobacter sp. HMF4947]|uniref:RagB/SusD family nutrient uptake outer membrane protein n=1 Tax=Hymenobacter ginkgonis TaxID=2682976 RepID=A0A7K1TGG6_9BACT|nr:RagB/SusD family nutrient uptake outer membrane protein [Hymenobacter ginkgonis]MVN77506.1 RagB/SusD family nutrient uptake outer membrane protein [Hymenobacter ginkgonis]